MVRQRWEGGDGRTRAGAGVPPPTPGLRSPALHDGVGLDGEASSWRMRGARIRQQSRAVERAWPITALSSGASPPVMIHRQAGKDSSSVAAPATAAVATL